MASETNIKSTNSSIIVWL